MIKGNLIVNCSYAPQPHDGTATLSENLHSSALASETDRITKQSLFKENDQIGIKACGEESVIFQ